MGQQHAPSHDQDAGLFGRYAQRSIIDEPVHDNQCPANTNGCDSKDPFHSQLWAHHVDDHHEPQLLGLGRDLFKRAVPGIERAEEMAAHGADKAAGVGFKVGDFVLDHGGQVVLDAAGFVPYLNIATESAQGLYHTAHSAYDDAHGDYASAKHQGAEALWHWTGAGLNAALPEGSSLERIHQLVEGHEAAWDFTSSMVGDGDTLPFFGGIIPWVANGAGREGESK